MTDYRDTIVTMVLNAWHQQIEAANKLLTQLSDDELMQEIVPGRSRGIYLLGHLAAAHDQMFHLLGFCKVIFPEYENMFMKNPDKTVADLPPVEEVKQAWNNINIQLGKCFNQIHLNEWFERHAVVSEADFVKQPYRNKLNIVLTRVNHLRYHLGQLILLKR